MSKDYDSEVLFGMYKEKCEKIDELRATIKDMTNDLDTVTDKLFHTLNPQSAWIDLVLKLRLKHKLDK